MSDISSESPEISEPSALKDDSQLGPQGRASMQGDEKSAPSDTQVYIDDLQKHQEDLYKHRERMLEIGNLEALNETDQDIKKINQILYEQVQKKNNITPLS